MSKGFTNPTFCVVAIFCSIGVFGAREYPPTPEAEAEPTPDSNSWYYPSTTHYYDNTGTPWWWNSWSTTDNPYGHDRDCRWSEESHRLDLDEVLTITTPLYGEHEDDYGYDYDYGYHNYYCYTDIYTESDQVIEFWLDYAEGSGYWYESEFNLHADDFHIELRQYDVGAYLVTNHNYLHIYYNYEGWRAPAPMKLRFRAISQNIPSLPVGSSPCSGEAAVDITVDEHSWTKLYSPGWVTDDAMPAVPRDVYCLWKLRAPPGMLVEVQLEFLDLQEGEDCLLDYLEVRPNTVTYTSSSADRICGNRRFDSHFTESQYASSAVVAFRSANVNHTRSVGFNARARAVEAPYSTCGSGEEQAPVAVEIGSQFTSYNHPNDYFNLQCESWLIEAESPLRAAVHFNSIDLAYGDNCTDYINVYTIEADDTRTLSYGSPYCGHYYDFRVVSGTHRMLVTFTTDESLTSRGFNAYALSVEYYPRCDDEHREPIQLTTDDVIESYGYPDRYRDDQCEEWMVTVTEGMLAMVEFSAFNTELCCDELEVYSVSDDFSSINNTDTDLLVSLRGDLGGNSSEVYVVSTTNRMYLRFHTDGSITFPGFSGVVGEVPPDSPQLHFCVWDENYSPTHLAAGDELIVTSRYWYQYSCIDWDVRVDEGQYAALSLRTEHIDCYQATLSAYTWHEDGTKTLITRYCDDEGDVKLISETNRMFVKLETFRRIPSINGTVLGVSDSAGHDCGGLREYENEGVIVAAINDDIGLYHPNSECYYLVTTQEDTIIEFSISYDVEWSSSCSYDALTLYEGRDTDSRVLRRLCGQRENYRVFSRGNAVLLVFTSDFAIEGLGFIANFTTRDPNEIPWLRCGEPAVQPRIVGGRPAIEGSIPWMAALTLGWYDPLCGASIIDDVTVITAAHCVEDTYGELYVAVGMHDTSADSNPDTVQLLRVRTLYIHTGYHMGSDGSSSDIALLLLDEAIQFNDRVSTICLPVGEPRVGEECVVSGWGDTDSHIGSPDELYMVEVPIVDNGQCREMYQDYHPPIDDTMVCAGPENGGKDSCQGDSGGPMACYNAQMGSWELTGVVSWGRGCALRGYPGVYADVNNLREFIDNPEEHIVRHLTD